MPVGTDDFIALPPDGNGKKVRTVKVTVGSNDVHQEVDVLGYNDGSLADADIQKLRNLDLTITALRDALKGTTPKTLADIVAAIVGNPKVNIDNLDVTLSSVQTALKGASSKSLTDVEADLAAILAKLDLTSTGQADRIRGAGNKTLSDLDADLSMANATLEDIDGDVEAVTTAITTQVDLKTSGLRDALRGVSSKTLSDVDNDLATVHSDLGSVNTILGTTSDVAVAGDNPGTIKAALRYIAKVLASVWSGSRLLVDGSGVTQPVSGSVAVSNLPATQPVTNPNQDAAFAAPNGTPPALVVVQGGSDGAQVRPLRTDSRGLLRGAGEDETLSELRMIRHALQLLLFEYGIHQDLTEAAN